MLRLATQFDRVASRPVVAAPKSHACSCCCCCCIVTVVGFSVVTARATYRAIRMQQAVAPASPAARAMDGWSVEPVTGGAATGETAVGSDAVGPSDIAQPTPEPKGASSHAGSGDRARGDASTASAGAAPTTDAAAATIGTTPSTKTPGRAWIVFAALLVPATFCVVPSLLVGVYMLAYSVFSSLDDHNAYMRNVALLVTGGCWAMLAGALAFLRVKGRLGIVGIAIPTVLMAIATAGVLFDPQLFMPGPVLVWTMWIGGLVALHRGAGVKRSTLIAVGVLWQVAVALEVGLWLGVLFLAVSR